MKAQINGITVEGTPQEIMEYQRLKAKEANKKPFAEVCRDLGETIGALAVFSKQVQRLNDQIRKQNVSFKQRSVENYEVSKNDYAKMIN